MDPLGTWRAPTLSRAVQHLPNSEGGTGEVVKSPSLPGVKSRLDRQLAEVD